MDFSDKNPAQILNEAALNLEQGTWYQGSFVKFIDQKPCFCAHGSIQYCGNKNFYEAVEEKNPAAGVAAATTAAATAAAAGITTAAGEYWDQYYNQRYPQHRNLFLAHFYAWKVGLSYDYNDRQSTTKQEVIAKLREAAQLALLG